MSVKVRPCGRLHASFLIAQSDGTIITEGNIGAPSAADLREMLNEIAEAWGVNKVLFTPEAAKELEGKG